jgi:ribosomal protein S18 acetylase RimI-like enzyme
MTVVRPAAVDDADELGEVHVRAWQAAYRDGLMPDEYLDSLSATDRAQMWRQALESGDRPRSRRLVAEDESGTIVGFVIVGPAEGDLASSTGEVFALNVHPHHWGDGGGRMLLEAGVGGLQEDGFIEAVLWVHPDNQRARRFYERNGWVCDDLERTQEIFEVIVPEVRYRRSLG